MGRVRQSLLYERSQLSGSGQFVTVPENRIKPCRHFSEISVRPNQMLWHAKGFEPFSQPSGPILVLVRVGYKRTVFVCLNVTQLRCPSNLSIASITGKPSQVFCGNMNSIATWLSMPEGNSIPQINKKTKTQLIAFFLGVINSSREKAG